MNRILIAGLGLLLAAGIIYYLITDTPRVPDVANEHLSFVPADSLAFAGGVGPIPVRSLLEYAGPDYSKWIEQNDLNQLYKHTEIREAAAGIKLVRELLFFYLSNLTEPATLLAKLGLADAFQITAYSVGVTPVLRIEVADQSAFEKTFESIEHKAGVVPHIREIRGVAYKTYPLVKDSDGPSFIVANYDGDAVFIVDLGGPEALATAIGVNKPMVSFAQTGELQRLSEKYDYSDFGMFMLDHRAVATALTSEQNQAGQAIGRLLMNSESENDLKLLRNRICAQELGGITRIWPRTVAGYRDIELQDDLMSMEVHSAIEIDDPKLVQTLQKMRGYIPRALQDGEEVLFALALGIDVSRLGEATGELVRFMREWDYQCPALQPLNRLGQDATSTSMTLALGTAMVQGVKGLSVSVLDLELTVGHRGVDLKNIDAVLAIAAENPETLLDNVAAIPGIGAIAVPEDGTPVDVPLSIPIPGVSLVLPLKVALSGNHVTIFVGKKVGQFVNALANESLEASGLLYYKIDYQSYVDALVAVSGSTADAQLDANTLEALEALRAIDAVYDGQLDVTENGIELTGGIMMRRPGR